MRDPFVVSGILWHEIGNKVSPDNTNKVENLLNTALLFENYGSGLTGLAFIFIVVQPDNRIHEEVLRYSRKKRELYIQKKLPYDLVVAYDKPQVLQLMAATYLETLETLDKKRIPNFDLPRFRADVQALFEAQGWLVETPLGQEP
ncbi:MAG TPA: hypothetical protein PKC76_13660 [Saprospiraceae bacterium]|nr:hypothetical protein [Saprospiraceae bacterium]HMP25181.1 hypothetical protein [Saprospiraceae bacterium]